MTSTAAATTTSSISSGRNNTLVAESDLQAAMQGLEERLKRSLSKYDDGDAVPSDNQNTRRLLQECGNSLKRNIERIVQPVTDEAFHVFVKRNDDNDEDDGTKTEDAGDSYETTNEEEEEYDEEDLLDPEAVQRVKELRQKIRAQAASVQKVRQEVLEQAVTIGQRQVHLWLGKYGDSSKAQAEIEVAALDTTRSRKQVDEMHESVANMVTALHEIGKEIPDKLSSLQETVAAIEKSLSRKEEGTLSQTERAILSRDEDVAMGLMNEVSDISPEKRLANFLGQE